MENVEIKEIKLVMVELKNIMQNAEGLVRYGQGGVAEGARILKYCIQSLKILRDLENKIEKQFRITKDAESHLVHANNVTKQLVLILRQREAELHSRSPREEMDYSTLEKDIGIALKELNNI